MQPQGRKPGRAGGSILRPPPFSALPRCCEALEKKAASYAPHPPRPRPERGGQPSRNTHQKMVPNFILLQSSVKSSKRTLSVSWKRLSSASQSVCRPGGVPMTAKPKHHTRTSPPLSPRKPGPDVPPLKVTHIRSVTYYPGPLAPPPAGLVRTVVLLTAHE